MPGCDINCGTPCTMTSAWKIEEQVIRSIVRRNCKTADDEKHLKIHIYYKSPKTSSLLMQNNLLRNTATLKQTNVVYRFQCKAGDCATRQVYYIGHTSLSKRLTMHLQDRAPKKHYSEQHNTTLTPRQPGQQHSHPSILPRPQAAQHSGNGLHP